MSVVEIRKDDVDDDPSGDPPKRHDFLAFGHVIAEDVTSGDPRFEPSSSLFYSYRDDRFRALVEYVYSPKEKELERFQLGVRFGEATAWAGRFHVPLGYANTAFHHGTFLETAITRGRAWRYEDEGGLIPTHVSGLLFEGDQIVGQGSVRYRAGIASGPSVTATSIEPVDLLRPKFKGSPAYMMQVAYAWDDLGERAMGGYAGRFDMPVEDSADRLNLSAIGAYVNVVGPKWTTRAEAMTVRVTANGYHERFTDAYIEMERHFGERLTGFSRAEAASSRGGRRYLDRSPDFPRRELVVGIRYDFHPKICGKLEFARAESFQGLSSNTVRAQLCVMLSK